MTFKRPPARPAKQYEGANPAAPRSRVATSDIVSTLEFGSQTTPSRPKLKTVETDESLGRRIRESARGEECLVRLVGVCTHDATTTIWSHGRWGAQLGGAGRGMSTKALDLCGAYACSACDAAFDQHAGAKHLTREQIDMDWMLGHLRSLGRLHEKGLL